MELFIALTKGMGEPTYKLLLSLIASWRLRLVQCVLHRRFFAGYSLGLAVVWRLSRSKYIILCESRGQRALNGSILLDLLVTGYLT